MAGEPSRLAVVRAALATGEVDSLRTLAARVADAGFEVGPDQLRADLRRLGVVRVEGSAGVVLAVPAGDDRSPARSSPGLRARVAADADWPLQVAVAVVVALFLVVGLAAWLISP